MTLQLKFIYFLSFLACLVSCEKPEEEYGSGTTREIKVIATVPNTVYANDRNIQLNASNTGSINPKKKLSYNWTCKLFPVGQEPKINEPFNAVATIDSLTVGKYDFQLSVKDDFGHLTNSIFTMEVFPDTLTLVAPKIVPIADQNLFSEFSVALLDASLSFRANPANRKLNFEWSLIQKPAGNPDPFISDKANISTYIKGLDLGNYQVMLKITNEKGLSSYDTIGINVLQATSTVTKEYESQWVLVTFDFEFSSYVQLTIIDPDNFNGRTFLNTKITVLDMETQQLLDNVKYNWQINDTELILSSSETSLDGRKVKVTVTYYR